MICNKCKEDKSDEEFHWKVKHKTRQRSCKACQRAYNKSHYNRNVEYYKQKARRHNSKVTQSIQDYVWRYLLSHPCVDCGESDPVVLQFDHQKEKNFNISTAISQGIPLETVQQEIAKCAVRCANCHLRRHALERNDWKVQRQASLAQRT